jgi:hypothetical protein
MTRPQYLLLLVCSVIALVLGATSLTLHCLSQRAETNLTADQLKLARQQEEINRGEVSRRVIQNLIQDLSGIAQKPEVQNLLARYGITLRKNSEADTR